MIKTDFKTVFLIKYMIDGDWGLGNGDCGLGIFHYSQKPIP